MPPYYRALNTDASSHRDWTRVVLYGLAFLAVAFWGASFAATKIALDQLSPSTLIFLRTSIGILLLAMVALATRSFRVRLRIPWVRLFMLGFLGVAFHQWIQAQGLRWTSTTDTGWIIATIPIFVALLGWRYLGERMNAVRITGIIFGVIGVILVISDGQLLGFFNGFAGQLGNAYILLSAINWAIFTVVSKRWLFTNSSITSGMESDQGSSFRYMIQAMFRLMIMGWIVMIPWIVVETPIYAIRAISQPVLGAVVFLGIACSGLAYIFWYAALTKLDATETSVLLYLEPLVTQAVAWSFLGEPLTLGIVLGGCVIFLGVWMVGRF